MVSELTISSCPCLGSHNSSAKAGEEKMPRGTWVCPDRAFPKGAFQQLMMPAQFPDTAEGREEGVRLECVVLSWFQQQSASSGSGHVSSAHCREHSCSSTMEQAQCELARTRKAQNKTKPGRNGGHRERDSAHLTTPHHCPSPQHH